MFYKCHDGNQTITTRLSNTPRFIPSFNKALSKPLRQAESQGTMIRSDCVTNDCSKFRYEAITHSELVSGKTCVITDHSYAIFNGIQKYFQWCLQTARLEINLELQVAIRSIFGVWIDIIIYILVIWVTLNVLWIWRSVINNYPETSVTKYLHENSEHFDAVSSNGEKW
jgi:cellulose synthase/poly-beta-1,6-N-acetylglucosamine synthase-like glycosyltransferase